MRVRSKVTMSTVAIAAAWIVAASFEARAACNSIPGPWSLSSKSSGSSTARLRLEFSHRGEVGRIDRALIVPGVTRSIRVISDPGHASIAQRTNAESENNMLGLVVKHRGPAKKPFVRMYKPRTPAQTAQDMAASLVSSLGPENVLSASTPLVAVPSRNGLASYEMQLPGRRAVARDKREPAGGSLSIIVVEAGKDQAVTIANVLESSVGRETCTDIVTALDHTVDKLVACVDRIFGDYAAIEARAATARNIDAFTCGVAQTEFLNDFHKQCDTNTDGVPPGYGRCIESAAKISATICPNGNLAIPFDYTELRKLNGKKNKLERKLAGRSAVSRGPLDASSLANPGRIILPGREFVGTLRPDYTGNPKKPDIDVENDSDSDDEGFVRVHGSVDENESVVILAARMLVEQLCNGTGEACQTFETSSDGAKTKCSATDGCYVDTPRYFACDGGGTPNRADMPCTKQSHCGVGGKCNVRPSCRPLGATWAVAPNDKGSTCRTDDGPVGACTDPYPQCGYTLFDFTSRASGDDKTRYDLIYEIATDKVPGELGVCKSARSTVCDDDSDCPQDTGPCLRYSLEARRNF